MGVGQDVLSEKIQDSPEVVDVLEMSSGDQTGDPGFSDPLHLRLGLLGLFGVEGDAENDFKRLLAARLLCHLV